MMDCKKALVEAEGDFDAAIELLRKKGQKVAANRADRDSSEGAVIARVNDDATIGVVVSVNCETDFVAKNDSYVALANKLADIALGQSSKEAFLTATFEGDLTVADKLTEQTGVIGEKIEIGGFERLDAPFVGSYIHAGNKIATLVSLSASVEGAAEAAKNVAMQAAAMNPIALNEEGVDAAVIEKEIEIAKDQLRAEGKPEAMLDNIAKGKIKRFFKDNTLVNQDYIKDSKQSVAAYVKSVNPDLVVTGFKRLALG
jgi:elongation factor Ts